MSAKGHVPRWAELAAGVIARHPWRIVACCYLPVLLSVALLYFFPLYVDTGVNAVYARKTTISNRINSLILMHKTLPSAPTNVTRADLEPEVLDLVAHHGHGGGGGGGGQKHSVFDRKYQFYELHVLAHARRGDDVLGHASVTQTCRFQEAVFAEQRRSGICLPRASSQEPSDDSGDGESDGGAAGPARAPDGSAATAAAPDSVAAGPAPSSAADVSEETVHQKHGKQHRKTPKQHKHSKPHHKRHRSHARKLNAAAGEAAAAPLATPPPPPTKLECQPPFSLFSVRPAIEAAGYGGYLDLLAAVAPYATPDVLDQVQTACSLEPGERGVLLCAGSPAGDGTLACDAAGCAAEHPACRIAGVDPCGLFSALHPSAAEIAAVAALPAQPLHAAGCDAIDWDGLDATLTAFRTLLAWSERSSRFSSFALLVNALVDTSFAARGGTATETTRMVFAVPPRTQDDPDAGATLAARAAALAAAHATPDVEFIWRQWRYLDVYAGHALVRDIAFSAGSLTFLFCYTWLQVGSLALTALIILTILASLPLALAIYAVVLGVRWIGVLHFLGIFIILGIGADDIFVVLDHWKHSLTEARAEGAPEAPGTVPRLAWTLQHALTSITATSFTTVAAFAANLTSSITPVRLFGLFMVVLVLVNYVFVLTLLLALLVLREGKGEASGEQGEKQGLLAPATELVPLGGVRSASPSERISPCDEPPGALSDAPSREEARAQSSTGASTSASQGAAEGSAQYGTLGPERRRGRGCCRCIGPDGGRLAAHAWLGGPFADALYAARWGVVAAAALAVAFFGWRASLLTLPSSRPTVWRAGSNIHKYYDLEMTFTFGRALERIPLSLVWGVAPQDTGSLNSVYEYTDAVLDTGADLTSPAAQAWLEGLCHNLTAWSHEPQGPIVSGSVRCPTPMLKRIVHARNASIPVAAEAFAWQLQTYGVLTHNKGQYPPVQFATEAMRSASGFVASGHTFRVHTDLDPARAGGVALRPRDTRPRAWVVDSSAGSRTHLPRGLVTWSAANFTTPAVLEVGFTLKDTWVAAAAETAAVWRTWEDWVRNATASAPPGLRNGFQTSDDWRVLEQQEVMYRSGMLSLALSLFLACLTLVLVTRAFVLAALASACIASVVLVFLGAMQLLGWTLGVVECVGIAIMVGLAVDYIVHMSTAVAHCGLRGRDAVGFALRTVGLSVVSGAVTTIGAAVFLLPCEMAVFQQFGTMVVITLFTALVFALVVFPALCDVALSGDRSTPSQRAPWRRRFSSLWRRSSAGEAYDLMAPADGRGSSGHQGCGLWGTGEGAHGGGESPGGGVLQCATGSVDDHSSGWRESR